MRGVKVRRVKVREGVEVRGPKILTLQNTMACPIDMEPYKFDRAWNFPSSPEHST